MDVKDLKWYAYYHDWNGNKIRPFNIFNHRGFRDDVEKYLKKYKNKDEFAERLKSSLMYYYWSKCEWEIVITPWMSRRDTEDIKIDVYDQVMNNWNVFLDYVWSHRPAKRSRRNKSVGKCYMAKKYCKHSSNGYCIAEDNVTNECPYLNAVGEITRLSTIDEE